MQKFTLAGREWHWPKMTSRVVNYIRDKHGVDLRGLIRQDAGLATTLADDGLMFDTFADLCGEQIKESGLSLEQLAEAFDHDGLTTVRESLVEGFFSLCLGPTRAKEAVAKMRDAGL